MRDIIADGHGNESDLYVASRVEYDEMKEQLISLMRKDLDQAI